MANKNKYIEKWSLFEVKVKFKDLYILQPDYSIQHRMQQYKAGEIAYSWAW